MTLVLISRRKGDERANDAATLRIRLAGTADTRCQFLPQCATFSVDFLAGAGWLRAAPVLCALAQLGLVVPLVCAASPALGTQLLQPTSVAYDASGNLYFAESRNHVVRQVSSTGVLTTVAGSATQGFSGDGGPATSAELDSPRGVALDAANNLYISDTHNNRIRRVDAVTHQISTLAGTGVAGFAGDGGPGTAANLNAPLGLALDGSNHLYIADSGNQRLRVLDLTSGTIATTAGTGQQGFAGDNGPALSAMFNSPTGLAADSYGNLFISDTGNHRIREVSSATRKVVTLAGDGTSGIRMSRPEGLSLDANGGLLIADAATHCIYLFNLASGRLSLIAGQGQQAFAGDQGLATLALLDSPNGVAFSPGGMIAVADTDNGRVRQISSESGGTITSIAGLGSVLPSVVLLNVPPVSTYGSAVITTTFSSATPGSGVVRLSEVTAGNQELLETAPLIGSSAVFDLSSLSAGTHQLLASYSGDSSHTPAQSSLVSLTIAPLPVAATIVGPALVYGQPLPSFSGTLTGVLPRDQTNVQVVTSLISGSFPLPPGSYPLLASLTGAAANNYQLAQGAAAITITPAPALISLSHDAADFKVGVASSTLGRPTGAVALMTASGSQLASIPVSASGQTAISDAGLTAGTYSVVAIYSGDTNFLSSRSAALNVVVGGTLPAPAAPDFSITPAGGSAQSAQPGGTANFNFAVTAAGQAMAGPILLAVQGAPPNSSATFTPSQVTAGTTAANVTLNVVLARSTAGLLPRSNLRGSSLAVLLPILLLPWRGRRKLRGGVLCMVLCLPLLLAGCGDRVFGPAATSSSTQSYSLLVIGTTTRADGSTLQHSTTVTLTVP